MPPSIYHCNSTAPANYTVLLTSSQEIYTSRITSNQLTWFKYPPFTRSDAKLGYVGIYCISKQFQIILNAVVPTALARPNQTEKCN